MSRIFKKTLVVSISVFVLFTDQTFAQTSDAPAADEMGSGGDEVTDYAHPDTYIESIDRDDLRPEGKYSIEVGASMLELHPDFFDNEEYNTSSNNVVKLIGPQLRFGRSFTISQRFDTSTYIQGQFATASSGSTPFDLNRTSQYVNFQLIQHLAYNFFGVQFDGAYLQYFVGAGLQSTQFTDKYSDYSGTLTNSMKAMGWVAETGLRLNNSETGFFSSLRLSTFKNTSFNMNSSGDAHTDLAIRDSAELSTVSQPSQISVGVGSYFLRNRRNIGGRCAVIFNSRSIISCEESTRRV